MKICEREPVATSHLAIVQNNPWLDHLPYKSHLVKVSSQTSQANRRSMAWHAWPQGKSNSKPVNVCMQFMHALTTNKNLRQEKQPISQNSQR